MRSNQKEKAKHWYFMLKIKSILKKYFQIFISVHNESNRPEDQDDMGKAIQSKNPFYQ